MSLNPIRAVTRGFRLKTIADAGVIFAGSVGNGLASETIYKRLPANLQSKPVYALVGVASAGVMGFMARVLGLGHYAANVSLGGLAYVINDIAQEYLGPALQGLTGWCPSCSKAQQGLGASGSTFIPPFRATNVRHLGDAETTQFVSPGLSGSGDTPTEMPESLWGSEFSQSAADQLGTADNVGGALGEMNEFDGTQ